MQRIERIEHHDESLMVALQGWQTGMWTTLPGIIQSFDATQMTVSVQPSIQAQLANQKTNTKNWVNLPLLVDVPIVVQSAGGMSITLPIKLGDECLVCFSSRCIDAWWQLGGVQKQIELRMHDLSDGFAFIGPRSLPRIIANYSTTTMQIRSDDGSAVIDINPTTHALTMTAASITINGPLTVNGNQTSTGTITNNGKEVGSAGRNTGVTVGTGISGGAA